MPQQVTARLPDPMVEALDSAARQLRRSRADVIRLAVERYLEDFDDLSVAIDRLRDPGDPVLDWDRVRRELADTGLRSARPGSRGGVRLGDNRVPYEVRDDELIVLVVRVANRCDAYRRTPRRGSVDGRRNRVFNSRTPTSLRSVMVGDRGETASPATVRPAQAISIEQPQRRSPGWTGTGRMSRSRSNAGSSPG